MAKNLQLLDCTLRDGGYLNDWEFKHDTLVNVFERVVSSGVDIIEIGFLDQRREFDINRSIMPDTASVSRIYGELDRKNTMVVGMIDYGTCDIGHLQPCEESYLDGIRVIFKQHVMREAIDYCRQVKALGYKVFVQAVSITTYKDEDLRELVALVNDLKPYAISMVDTYGLLHQENLYHIFEVLDGELLPEIRIGYHAHNNFQMGYANGIKILEAETERSLLVDGTLYGMGKSAGNTPLELLAMYMNEHFGKNYDLNQILEAIDTSIMDIYNEYHWGYNLYYFIAASNKVHPNYVFNLINKRTLSIKSINEILKKIDDDKKLLYDKNCIEELYAAYEKYECDDTAALGALAQKWPRQELLVIGPGRSCIESREAIEDYLRVHRPTVITINFIPDWCRADYVFLTNSKRHLQLSTQLSRAENRDIQVVATSNVTKASGTFTYEINYSNVIDPTAVVQDNSLIMLMKLFIKVGVRHAALAGFDGYVRDQINYFRSSMEYRTVQERADELNAYAKEFFRENRENIAVDFITPSLYNDQV